jgi:hypothetical protein
MINIADRYYWNDLGCYGADGACINISDRLTSTRKLTG